MNTVQGKPQTVVVAGDITVNWNLARTQEAAASREAGVDGCARLSGEYGGAVRLARLLAAAAEALRGGGTELSVHGPVSAQGLPNSDDERFHHEARRGPPQSPPREGGAAHWCHRGSRSTSSASRSTIPHVRRARPRRARGPNSSQKKIASARVTASPPAAL